MSGNDSSRIDLSHLSPRLQYEAMWKMLRRRQTGPPVSSTIKAATVQLAGGHATRVALSSEWWLLT